MAEEGKLFISACMIVKNEQDNIEACLTSIAPFVDEIVVLDTGSTDDTVNMLAGLDVWEWSRDSGNGMTDVGQVPLKFRQSERFTADIDPLDFHFGDARNEAKGYVSASVDWIISIDADERAEGDSEQLREHLAGIESQEKFAPPCIHVPPHLTVRGPRIFRPCITWSGRVHELPSDGGKGIYGNCTPNDAFRLMHTRPAQPEHARERNIPLIRKSIQEEGKIGRSVLLMAQEMHGLGRCFEAIGYMTAYLEADRYHPTTEYPAHVILSEAWYKVGCMAKSAEHAGKAIAACPFAAGGYIRMSAVYMRGEAWRPAIFYLEQAARLERPDPIYDPIDWNYDKEMIADWVDYVREQMKGQANGSCTNSTREAGLHQLSGGGSERRDDPAHNRVDSGCSAGVC